ncbi:MAG: S41 family peptidase [Sphingomicrobium sp.]
MHMIFSLAALAMLPASSVSPTTAVARADTQVVEGRKIATAIRALLDKYYVIENLRPKFDARIDAGLASGRYDTTDSEQLVERLNEDLHAVTADKHLHAMFDPERSRALASAPAGSHADDASPTAAEVADAERRNHGLNQLKIFPGNIRYLETTGFVWAGEASERAYDDAMRFLAGGDAAIIDMRINGGGSPDAVRYLVSHFLPADKPLMTFHMTTSGTTSTATLPRLRAPSMAGKPLYVLTSSGTASAAEEFVGHVSGYKIGELIGETTAGAGFRNQFFALPGGMVISISVGQAILASTGKGWEAVGFAPDTTAPVDKALEVAEAHAFKRFAESASPAKRRNFDVQAALLLAEVTPVKTALPASGYAGVYGERTVRADINGITIQRTGGPVTELVAIGPNLFAYTNDPGATLSFDVAGNQAIALHLVRSDGSTADGTRQR